MTYNFTKELWQNPGEGEFIIQFSLEEELIEKPLIQVYQHDSDQTDELYHLIIPRSLHVVNLGNPMIILRHHEAISGHIVVR